MKHPTASLLRAAACVLSLLSDSVNRQLVSVGNLAVNDRAALILVDYARRVRLKLLGHLKVRDLAPGDGLSEQLIIPGYRARAQRAFVIQVEAYDWNCPQHIPQCYGAEDVQKALDERDARNAELEARLIAVT